MATALSTFFKVQDPGTQPNPSELAMTSARSRTTAWGAINKSNGPIEPSEQEINYV
jgi:hypothetical protein